MANGSRYRKNAWELARSGALVGPTRFDSVPARERKGSQYRIHALSSFSLRTDEIDQESIVIDSKSVNDGLALDPTFELSFQILRDILRSTTITQRIRPAATVGDRKAQTIVDGFDPGSAAHG
jgi:hypothetical protein